MKFKNSNHICTQCGEPCDIDDGSVEPELMARAIRSPFPPSSACCGADYMPYDSTDFIPCESCDARMWGDAGREYNAHAWRETEDGWFCPECREGK